MAAASPVSSQQRYLQTFNTNQLDIFCNGITYSVQTAKSSDDLNLPEGLGMDRRVLFEDTEDAHSSFSGISPDKEYKTSQVFLIKHNGATIGISTLICIPHKFLHKKGFIESQDGKLILRSFLDLYNCIQDTFLIELGWFQILPDYRNKGIAKTILTKAIIPILQNILKNYRGDVYISCAAQGLVRSESIRETFSKWENGSNPDKNPLIEVSEEEYSNIGKTHENATFTPIMAERLGLLKKENIYNWYLGPVFISNLKDLIFKTML